MKTIAQRTLRNESGEILPKAEASERFVITIHGRPVAQLGPYSARTWVRRDSVREVLALPTDSDLGRQLRQQDAENPIDPWPRDPWQQLGESWIPRW